MLMEIVICLLAAAGILFVAWTTAAVLVLPAQEDCVLIAASGDAQDLQQRVRAHTFLRESGLTRARIVIVDCGLSEEGIRLARKLAYQSEGVSVCGESLLSQVWKTGRSV